MKTILYVCVHNAGRSQMAQAITNQIAKERGLHVRAISAGTEPAESINPQAFQALSELGIGSYDLSPKLITKEMVDGADRAITMGCGVDATNCPIRFGGFEDWGLDDPKGKPLAEVRKIRDQIKERVELLLSEFGAG